MGEDIGHHTGEIRSSGKCLTTKLWIIADDLKAVEVVKHVMVFGKLTVQEILQICKAEYDAARTCFITSFNQYLHCIRIRSGRRCSSRTSPGMFSTSYLASFAHSSERSSPASNHSEFNPSPDYVPTLPYTFLGRLGCDMLCTSTNDC